MQEEILKEIHHLYSSYKSTLLALSGGIDSIVLFHLLYHYAQQRGDFQLQTFYLNHNMPNNKIYAEQCQNFTQILSTQYNIHHHTRVIDIAKEKEGYNVSWEQAGRQARYQYLKKIQQQQQLESITTAHHKSDLVETVFVRLFKGGSPQSLLAIKKNQQHILRPLLQYSKSFLQEYAEYYHLEYCQDPTNNEVIYERNYIRQKICPVIRQQFPDYEQKTYNFLILLEEQNDYIEKSLPIWKITDSGLEIPLNTIENLHPFIIKESIKRAVTNVNSGHYFTMHILEFIKNYLIEHKDCPYKGKKILYQKKNLQIIRTKHTLQIKV